MGKHKKILFFALIFLLWALGIYLAYIKLYSAAASTILLIGAVSFIASRKSKGI
jgi:hypothetical protein